jgi:hypothetical protein
LNELSQRGSQCRRADARDPWRRGRHSSGDVARVGGSYDGTTQRSRSASASTRRRAVYGSPGPTSSATWRRDGVGVRCDDAGATRDRCGRLRHFPGTRSLQAQRWRAASLRRALPPPGERDASPHGARAPAKSGVIPNSRCTKSQCGRLDKVQSRCRARRMRSRRCVQSASRRTGTRLGERNEGVAPLTLAASPCSHANNLIEYYQIH